MEYLSGNSLSNMIVKKLGFNQNELDFYITETISALSSLHKNNIIYRDLKPENIMIADNGHLKLIDFGLSK